jgi:mono/diheme cytochrome c family protein
MAIVRAVSLIAGVLGVSLALAACGGEVGGTTTIATQPGTTTAPEETTSPKPEETTAKEKAAPEKTTAKGEGGGKTNATVEQGKQVFTANGCGACHTLAAAGTQATVGPDLDETLPGKSESNIRESIVDPNAEVAPGYSAGVMPPTFGSVLSSSELEALVTFLAQSAGQ